MIFLWYNYLVMHKVHKKGEAASMATTAKTKRKEKREMYLIGINDKDLEGKFKLRLPKICKCVNTQYVLKAEISDEYSSRGVLAKHFTIKCLKCGEMKTYDPIGEESLIEDPITIV